MNNNKKFYPVWLRMWHLLNALLFIVLLLTGINLHYSDSGSLMIPYNFAIWLHNLTGILLTASYLLFFVLNFTSGNINYYKFKLRGLISQLIYDFKYYVILVFDKDKRRDFTAENKFSTAQKVTYLKVMYLLMPLIIITGWLLLFPQELSFGMLESESVWLISLIHVIIAYFLSLFLIIHLYIGTTGRKASTLYKAIFAGTVPEAAVYKEDFSAETAKTKRKLLPETVYNTLSIAGGLLVVVSFVVFLFMFIVSIYSENHNPYLGIITFIVIPTFIVLGVMLIIIGIIRENKRLIQKKGGSKKILTVDFGNSRTQMALIIFTVGGMIFLLFSAFGSYKAFEYTESDEFCGTVCHKVMEPEYVTYKRSPHSNVGCVKCHIGSGADWFVKAKISGMYQVYAVLADIYPRPIATPVENLRPAQETCEQCHWPRNFFDEKVVSKTYYLSDEQNTKYDIDMFIKVGGGNIEIGNTSGIHWHMNLANEITYYHEDRRRDSIPWVKARNKETGKVTVYKLSGYEFDEKKAHEENIRKMDCIDCHNRPAHNYFNSNEIVNLYMAIGRINENIPWIKFTSVRALEENLYTDENLYGSILSSMTSFYENKGISLGENDMTDIKSAADYLTSIHKTNAFPHMKANWRRFPNNIGHMYTVGCFRCHDGNHVSDDGKVITNDCNACHTFISEFNTNDTTRSLISENKFVHPVKFEQGFAWNKCYNCHGSTSK